MKQSKIKDQKHCNDIKDHRNKHTFFCITCADKGYNCNVICFCAQCAAPKWQTHSSHTNFYKVESNNFVQRLNNFKQYLRKHSNTFKQDSSPFLKDLLDDHLNLNDKDFKKWLVNTKFWKFSDHRTIQQAAKQLIVLLNAADESKPKDESQQKQNYLIKWDQLQKKDDLFESMFKQAQQEKQKLIKQKKIVSLLIQAYSSCKVSSKKQTLVQIDKAIQQMPDECVLLMIKLYLLQLQQGNQSEWMPILKKIIQLTPSLKNSAFSLFIESHKFWVRLDPSQITKASKDIKFVDSTRGHVYKLTKPQQYTDLLSSALLSNNTSNILLAAKGLGLLAQQKYADAIRIFQSAANQNNESIVMNIHFAQCKQNPAIKVAADSLLEELSSKSKQYIINTIKWLSTQNMPEQIIECCQVLDAQNNANTFTKIQLVKAYLKTQQINQAQQLIQKIQKQQISDELRQKLQRKKIYAEARLSAKNRKFQQSTQHCSKLVKQKQSASVYYSLASALYNEQKWEQAEEQIDKALKIKPCEKYNKLKFYILIMRKQLQAAKKMLPSFNKIVIDPKIVQMLTSFA